MKCTAIAGRHLKNEDWSDKKLWKQKRVKWIKSNKKEDLQIKTQ